MSMSLDRHSFQTEIKNQMKDIQVEVDQLQSDYRSINDNIVKSQIKTFIEKKNAQLLRLWEVYYGASR